VTNPTPLSPAAQAVLDAVIAESYQRLSCNALAAAALRAAADQVVPADLQEAQCFTNEAIRLNRMGIRQQLLAIAAELKSANG